MKRRWPAKGSIYYAPGTTLYKQRNYARSTRNDTNGGYVYLCDNQNRGARNRKGNKSGGDDVDTDI